MTCGFQIPEVFCKQNLITSWCDLSYRTTWSDRLPTYTRSHNLLLISCVKETTQLSLFRAWYQKTGFWMWKSIAVTTCRSHYIKTDFPLFSHFSLYWKVYFFTLNFLKPIRSMVTCPTCLTNILKIFQESNLKICPTLVSGTHAMCVFTLLVK